MLVDFLAVHQHRSESLTCPNICICRDVWACFTWLALVWTWRSVTSCHFWARFAKRSKATACSAPSYGQDECVVCCALPKIICPEFERANIELKKPQMHTSPSLFEFHQANTMTDGTVSVRHSLASAQSAPCCFRLHLIWVL